MTQPNRLDGIHAGTRLEDTMRAAHARAVGSLSNRTRARLDLRIRAAMAADRPASRHGPAWGLALACSMALVAALGLRMRAPDRAAPEPVVPVDRSGDSDDLVASLDETPDLYLWLASSDASGLVSE